MSDTAATQTLRLIELIAWLSQRDGDGVVDYAAAARHLGVAAATIRDDLNVLFRLTDRYRAHLASLAVGVQADGFSVRSRGPFRRPFRLTPDEVLALGVGLAQSRSGSALAARLMRTLAPAGRATELEGRMSLGPPAAPGVEQVIALARRARDERRVLEIGYCGARGEAARRLIHPYQVVSAGPTWYVYAWCGSANAYRLFRAERVLDAVLEEERFTPRADFVPLRETADLLRAADPVRARVRFEPAIARWLRERYPGGRELPGGRYEVTFQVADPAWFVREVLQYGAEATVVEPESLRDAVRRMVAP